jgi:bacteriocin biosynthesis cyclodehydratase domain-containing protein
MRPALKPGLATVWRNRDTVQIGIDPRRAIALTGMRGARDLLRLLDGSRERHQVLAVAGDLGMDAGTADRVLRLLAAAGALDDCQAGGSGALPAGARARLAPELATASLAHRDADGGARILARRQAARVRVHGASRAGLWIAGMLTAAGVRLVMSTGAAVPRPGPAGSGATGATGATGTADPPPTDPPRAGPLQAAPPAADPPSAGSPAAGSWAADPPSAGSPAAGSWAADPPSAGSPAAGSWAADPPSAGSPAADPPLAGSALAGSWAAGLPGAGRTARADRSPRSRATRHPDLVVLADTHRRELPAALVRHGVPHLAASASEAIGVVGPLVLPGRSACLRCLDLTRAERDPAWPLILAQLAGQANADPLACDTVLAATVAAQAAAQALAFIDQGASATAVTNGTLELVLPGWQWRRRSWQPRPDCGCRHGG